MIEFTFLFVGQMLGRLRRVFRGRRGIHIHSWHSAHVVFLRPSQGREQKHREEREQEGCRSAMNSPGAGFSVEGQHLVLLFTRPSRLEFTAMKGYDRGFSRSSKNQATFTI